MPIRKLTLDEATAAFCKFNLQGYAGEAKKSLIPELPGYKVIVWEEGDWRFVDMYFTIPGNLQSFGNTTGWFSGVPIFFMSYGGWYDKRVTPFLKRALKFNYEKGIFICGRGPFDFRDPQNEFEDDLVYENHPIRTSRGSFHGWEEIKKSDKRMGYHEYWGRFIYNESSHPFLTKEVGI